MTIQLLLWQNTFQEADDIKYVIDVLLKSTKQVRVKGTAAKLQKNSRRSWLEDKLSKRLVTR